MTEQTRRTLWLLLVTLLVPGLAAARQADTITNDRIFDALALREGMTVCEIGAGDGELSIAAAARRVACTRASSAKTGSRRSARKPVAIRTSRWLPAIP